MDDVADSQSKREGVPGGTGAPHGSPHDGAPVPGGVREPNGAGAAPGAPPPLHAA